jgi:hypothetical protein
MLVRLGSRSLPVVGRAQKSRIGETVAFRIVAEGATNLRPRWVDDAIVDLLPRLGSIVRVTLSAGATGGRARPKVGGLFVEVAGQVDALGGDSAFDAVLECVDREACRVVVVASSRPGGG